MRDSLQIYYYIIVFLSMLYAFKKVGFNKISFLIILIFWEGLFQYIDRTFELSNNLYNVYKIIVVVYATYITGNRLFELKTKRELYLNLIFLLFSIAFWISYFINGGKIITILSQYLYKYGLVFILFHYFKDLISKEKKRKYVKNVVLKVLYIQIFLSIVKFIITLPDQIRTGYNIEAIVGSVSAGGAGLAVVLPIVGLIFYWLIKNGNFNRKDWLIAISFIMISIASMKRQPIILFPIFLYLLFSYVKKGIAFFSSLKYIPLVLFMFFIGVKLNPIFNPENKVWGSFDPIFMRNSISRYYFGTDDIDYLLRGNFATGIGRGGGVIFIFSPSKLKLKSLDEVLFGKGRYEVAVERYGRFTKFSYNYGLDQRGLIGEAAALIYSFGYLGAGLLIFFAVYLIKSCKNKRIGVVLLIYYLWDFFFYYNQVVYSNQSAIVVLCTIFMSSGINQFLNKNLIKEKNEKLIPS